MSDDIAQTDHVRLVGLTTVRNEGDIIAQSLDHAARLYDLILVVDCGSWDDTVARVKDVAAKHPHVVLLGTVDGGYAESVRRHVFARFTKQLPPRSWWGIVDADEFPAEDLRSVVATAHREGADHVAFEMAQFYLTRREVEAGLGGSHDRHLPMQERRRAYIMDGSWWRLFRNLPWLRWNKDTSWPTWLVRRGSRRIEIRHYQYRDLEQIRLRIDTRAQLALRPEFLQMHPHWRPQSVEACLMDDADPRLRWAESGQPLIRDAQMPAHWVTHWSHSAFHYARAILSARTPQRAAELLAEVDVQAVLHRMRSPRTAG
jgi:hypothetical protein